MRARTSIAGLALCLLLAHPAAAIPLAGLTESVWHTIPGTDYAPTSADISNEQARLQAISPAYSFINTVDGFNYSGGSTIGAFFGADATGTAAANDTTGPSFFAFDARGYLNVTTAGNYTFNLGSSSNAVDDAAQISVGGSVVAQQNFQAGLGNYVTTMYLNIGYTAFDLFYFQQGGGYNLATSITGPGGMPAKYVQTAISVPEPGTLATFLLALGVVGLALVRQFAGFALPKQSLAGPG